MTAEPRRVPVAITLGLAMFALAVAATVLDDSPDLRSFERAPSALEKLAGLVVSLRSTAIVIIAIGVLHHRHAGRALRIVTMFALITPLVLSVVTGYVMVALDVVGFDTAERLGKIGGYALPVLAGVWAVLVALVVAGPTAVSRALAAVGALAGVVAAVVALARAAGHDAAWLDLPVVALPVVMAVALIGALATGSRALPADPARAAASLRHLASAAWVFGGVAVATIGFIVAMTVFEIGFGGAGVRISVAVAAVAIGATCWLAVPAIGVAEARVAGSWTLVIGVAVIAWPVLGSQGIEAAGKWAAVTTWLAGPVIFVIAIGVLARRTGTPRSLIGVAIGALALEIAIALVVVAMPDPTSRTWIIVITTALYALRVPAFGAVAVIAGRISRDVANDPATLARVFT